MVKYNDFNEFIKETSNNLINSYLKDCFDLDIDKTGIDLFTSFYAIPNLKENFIRVPISPNIVGKYGDIIVGNNIFGIVISGNEDGVTYLNNNKETEDLDDYSKILGFLRPKNTKLFTEPFKFEVPNDARPKQKINEVEIPKTEVPTVEPKIVTPAEKLKTPKSKTKEPEVKKSETTEEMPYIPNQTYTLNYALRVRAGAGTEYSHLTYQQFFRYRDKLQTSPYAIFKNGIIVQFTEIIQKNENEYWGKIGHGYICLRKDDEEYVSLVSNS